MVGYVNQELYIALLFCLLVPRILLHIANNNYYISPPSMLKKY